MRKFKKIFPAAPFFATVLLTAALLLSCDLFLDSNTKEIPKEDPYPEDFYTLKPGEFYAQHIVTGRYYKVPAEMIYEGEHCVIWAEEGSTITDIDAGKIAREYDDVIRPKIAGAFGKKDFDVVENGENIHFGDILEYANWLTDGTDGKLTILLLDIQDGYDPENNRSYVAGYFFGGDFYPVGAIGKTGHFSNARDMIYIDTYPGLQKPEQSYSTFAHELQHLINFATTVQIGRTTDGKTIKYMDTWIDEGLSSQAEHIYLEDYPKDRCEWFRDDENKTIAKGNNFFVWNNHSGGILDEYATVYMFFRWLYLQAAKDDSIFCDIGTSPYYDHNIIVSLVKQKINSDWDSWEKVLRAWMTANYFPADNTYGYKSDTYLQDIVNNRQKFASGTSIFLYPGEGVYSRITDPFTPKAGGGRNIRYVGMNGSSFSLNPPYSGNVLLTFNANTTNKTLNNISITSLRETGYLTGITGITGSTTISRTAAVQETGFSGPYVIDAGDVLGRDRDGFPLFSGPFFQRAER